jgi:hypothetical protein
MNKADTDKLLAIFPISMTTENIFSGLYISSNIDYFIIEN